MKRSPGLYGPGNRSEIRGYASSETLELSDNHADHLLMEGEQTDEQYKVQ